MVGLHAKLSISSYDLVAEELGKTVQQAANVFEGFLEERFRLELLKECADDLRQVGGTLRLLQIPGAALIADEMRYLCEAVMACQKAVPERQLNALSTAFFVLPRYLEFIQQREEDIPLLSLPHANEIRQAHGQLSLPDSYFLDVGTTVFSRDSKLKLKTVEVAPDLYIATVRHSRHLFQKSLLAILKGEDTSLHLTMLSRAVRRLCKVLEAGPQQRFWLLADAMLESFREGGLELSPCRRRVLGGLESQLAALVQKRDHINDVLEAEIVVLLRLSSYRKGMTGRILQLAAITPYDISDADLREMRQSMLGLSYDTLSSVLQELRSELHHANDLLELLAQHQQTDAEEIKPLCNTLRQAADVLQILNLGKLAESLYLHATEMESLIDVDISIHRDTLDRVADSILFIDGSLAQVDRRKLNYQELNEIDFDKRRSISSGNQLEEAKSLVYEEVKGVISMVKRAISAYLEAGFDEIHIKNLPHLLHSVTGAFSILEMAKMEQLLKQSADFIERFVKRSQPDRARDTGALETLADGMICIEYYVNELAKHHHADLHILDMAEESLNELKAFS